MESFEITIIGAGVVGLAVAAELSRDCSSVLVVERNPGFGMETSSRNSEVIHAGIYYPTGSLKAGTCVEGNRALYDICARNNIPHKRLGKLIVASDKSEEPGLVSLYENALANGVPDIELIGANKVKALEPQVKAFAAIHSRTTGIIDSHALMKYFLFLAQQQGAVISFKSDVKAIERVSEGYSITVLDSAQENFNFHSRTVVNCAGLESDRVAGLTGLDVSANRYELDYWKGRYCKLADSKSGLISRLVYPLPDHSLKGLGVHATVNLAGAVRFGPDHVHVDRRHFDYQVEPETPALFFRAAAAYLSGIEERDLSPDTAGVRPKLSALAGEFRDFIVQEESAAGFPGMVNLIGIESPGLTASPALAKMVRSMVCK